jgi:DNA mismatch endonuclease (patch repair protein)
MVDVFSERKRSWIMSRIRGRHTKPDLKLVRILRSLRLRCRRYDRSLPGTPDAALHSERIAVFVHGCFWHGHPGCNKAALPSSNRVFWRRKIALNRRRDTRQIRLLRQEGWSVAVFWTCKGLTKTMIGDRVRRILFNRSSSGLR